MGGFGVPPSGGLSSLKEGPPKGGTPNRNHPIRWSTNETLPSPQFRQCAPPCPVPLTRDRESGVALQESCQSERRTVMIDRELIRTCALVASLMVTIGNAWAADEARYPDWGGQWDRFVVPGIPGQPSHDQTKPGGFGQQAPLTEESAKILRESLADQHEGGLGNFPTSWGRASGMPYMMMAFG